MKVLNRHGPLICDKCGSSLANRNTLFSHSNQQHRRAKRYCNLCPKSFVQKSHLKSHMEHVHFKFKQHFHLKLIEHKCNDCDYKSNYKSNLEKHMLRHGAKSASRICQKLVTDTRQQQKNGDDGERRERKPVERFAFHETLRYRSKRNLRRKKTKEKQQQEGQPRISAII